MPRKDKVVISMKDKLGYYESIRREYPEVITKDQFYRCLLYTSACLQGLYTSLRRFLFC